MPEAETEYEYIWKSNGLSMSQLMKDCREKGIEIGMEQGRNNMKGYVLYLLGQFGQDIENVCCEEVRESYFRLVKKVKEMK